MVDYSEDIVYLLRNYDIPEEITSEILSTLDKYIELYEEEQLQLSSFINKEVTQEVEL